MSANTRPPAPEPPPTQARPASWTRPLSIAAVLALGVSGAAWSWATSEDDPPYAQGANSYVIGMSDFTFSPPDMQWRVGERVTLTFINNTQAHPGRLHEFMMGRHPSQEETPFGTRYTGGFEEDFFAGVSVELSHSEAVSMVMPSESQLTGPDAGEPFVMEDMAMEDMEGMDMNDDATSDTDDMDMNDMDMNDEHTAEGEEHADEHAAEGDDHTSGDMAMSEPAGGHADHHGFMVELEPAGRTTISFVVPDKPGEWEYGCFSETGQHYANGMRGTVTITS